MTFFTKIVKEFPLVINENSLEADIIVSDVLGFNINIRMDWSCRNFRSIDF